MRRSRRIAILLFAFVLIAGTTFWERLWVRGWARPLEVAIYPIAMDETGAAFVGQLEIEDFQEIAAFLVDQGAKWGRKSLPTPQIELKPPLRRLPPLAQTRGGLDAIRLSLGLRWYAWRHTPFWASLGKVRLFVLYHQIQFDRSLPHSLGLHKGLVGVVHVFASEAQRAQNNVVIAHELLHTLGATDKYDAAGQPLNPIGYADPYANPLYPQEKAEIMAGRIPITASKAEIPKGLSEAMIGYKTASEIGW